MESGVEVAIGVAVEVVVGTIAAGVLYVTWGRIFGVPKRMKVLATQAGVILRGAKVLKTIAAGTYWISPGTSLVICDMRPKPFQAANMDLISSNAVAVRVSLGGEYRVSDPVKFLLESSDGFGALYLEIRQAVKTAVAEVASDELLGNESLITARLKELLVPRSDQLGIELNHLALSELIPVGRLMPM